VLVHGNSSRRELVQLGVPDDRIAVCGAPGLDLLPRQTHQTHPKLQERLGLLSDEPWILVATSGPGHRISQRHHQTVIDNLARLSAALPDLPVVVKLHRKDRIEFYRQAANQLASAKWFVLPADAPGLPAEILDWLQGCRIVLTGASMVAVEAMLMEVPVVTMDFRDEIHHMDFIDAGATSHVRTFDALECAVRAILAAGGQSAEIASRARAYLSEAFFALDGQSASRGAQVLREMAGSA
jgi:UDP-N-acetylglucosamine 2-epimerase